VYPPGHVEVPLDLSGYFVQSLEFLMLAQAQECVWQKAVLGKAVNPSNAVPDDRKTNHVFHTFIDNYKNGLVAKLASQVRRDRSDRCWFLVLPNASFSSRSLRSMYPD
jgi:hypothetical protein